jgi:DNA polymerase sigma
LNLKRPPKSNLIALEYYIQNHIKLTKRNTTNFNNAYFDISSYLSQNLNTEYKATVLPFGSVTQLSYNISSDLEITVITDHKDDDKVREDVISLIKANTNYTEVFIKFTRRTKIVSFYHGKLGVNVELMLNNHLGVLNSELIRTYSLMDARITILINIIKDWSKLHEVNGNFNGHLSSYCYTLMVIYFLQKYMKIIPVLQRNVEFSDLFMKDNNTGKMTHYLVERVHSSEGYTKSESFSLAELVYCFFKFYLYCFDENEYCIDISSENVVFRNNDITYLNRALGNNYSVYCFIDPYDFGYNPGCYLKKKDKSHKEFRLAMEDAFEKIIDQETCKNIFKKKINDSD